MVRFRRSPQALGRGSALSQQTGLGEHTVDHLGPKKSHIFVYNGQSKAFIPQERVLAGLATNCSYLGRRGRYRSAARYYNAIPKPSFRLSTSPTMYRRPWHPQVTADLTQVHVWASHLGLIIDFQNAGLLLGCVASPMN